MRRKSARPSWHDLALALSGARDKPLAAGFSPQLVTLVKDPPVGDEWLCETKWDGYRLLSDLDANRVRLRSRNDLDWTARLPHIARAVEGLPVSSARLDGELVALDRDGSSDFDALEGALEAKSDSRLHYALFDVVALERVDLSRVPLIQRKGLLERLLGGAGDSLIYSRHVIDHAREEYADAVRRRLEGIVCKRVESAYTFTRNRDWLKIKAALADEFIVVGHTAPRGSRAGFGSLLLAKVADGGLRYVGRVGTGFNEEQLRKLQKQLAAMRRATAPVALPEHAPFRVSTVTWVAPRLVVEVAYRGIAKLGLLRQASFLRLRIDKSPGDMGYRPKSSEGRA